VYELYVKFIQKVFLPELKHLTFKFKTWYTLKPNSLLEQYLTKKNIFLEHFFIANDLINVLELHFEKFYMNDPTNSEITILDQDLQICFNTKCVFKQDLFKYCEPHIDLVESMQELQSNTIFCNFYIDSPRKILYTDPFSQFWIHPLVNATIFKNKKITYSWKELCSTFYLFLQLPNQHFTSSNNCMYELKEDSILTNLFKFKHFHISQISDILNKITFFLGRTKNIATLCPKMTINEEYVPTIKILETIVNTNNSMVPYIRSEICI
jgi:hypothetical protein